MEISDLIKQSHDCNCWSNSRTCGQKIQQKPEVSVIVVNIIQVTQQLLVRLLVVPFPHPHVGLVRGHQSTQLTKARKDEPHEVEDVTEDVDSGDYAGDVETVDIELSRLAGALKVVTVNITDDGVGIIKNREALPTHVDKKNRCNHQFKDGSDNMYLIVI